MPWTVLCHLYGLVLQAVLADCGVAFISELAVREELKQGEIVAVPVTGLTITRTFSLVYRKGRMLSPAAAMFLETLRKVKL